MDHNTATIIRSGHAMPPGRVSISRLGQAQATIRGGIQDVGGMLVGDDNRLYGAAFPGSPLGVSRIRPHSATPAFRPLSGSTSGHNPHTSVHATANSTNGPLNNRSNNPGTQLHRASSTPRDRGLPGGGGGGGGAGGAAAARSISVSRGSGTAATPVAATAGARAAAAAPADTAPPSSRSNRNPAQQRITSSAGMSLLDRSLPAVRAAAALEEELVVARLKLTEAREEQRKAVAAVRKLEVELQEERTARVRLEDQLAAATKGRISAAWADPNNSAARNSERRVYTGRGSAATAAAAATAGESDGEGHGGGAAAAPVNGGVSPRARPASASAASSHLVSSLRWEIRQLTATRDALAAQLAEIRSTSRAQRLQELQSEMERYRDEVSRQMGLVKLLSSRLDAAEAEAAEARAVLQNKQDQAAEVTATAAVPLALPPGNNLSRNMVRTALVVLQRAHKVIMAEARLIKSTFPPLLSLPELRELAVQRPNSAGAVEALMFLTSHLARLMDEVRGLPGVPRLRGPLTAAEAREAAAAAAATAGGGAGAAAGAAGATRPTGAAALDIESQVAALTKMGLPGAGTISGIKAARAAAAVRANTIAAAAKAAAGSGAAAAAATRKERLAGRLSPGKTSRPTSARVPRAWPEPVTPAGVVSEMSPRLGRGVLLTPAAGDPVAAEKLKEKLTESVAALAAESRERNLDTSKQPGEAPAAASGSGSTRASRRGSEAYGSRSGSANGEPPATTALTEGHIDATEPAAVEAEAVAVVEADTAEDGAPLLDSGDLPKQRPAVGPYASAAADEEEEVHHTHPQATDGGDGDAYNGYGEAVDTEAAAEEGQMAEAEAAATGAAEGLEEGYGDGEDPPEAEAVEEPPAQAEEGELGPGSADGGGATEGDGDAAGDAAAGGDVQQYSTGEGEYGNAEYAGQEATGAEDDLGDAGYGNDDCKSSGEEGFGADGGGPGDKEADEGEGEGGGASEWPVECEDGGEGQAEGKGDYEY
ncbi:hypothetical protein VaNZ11_001512 [Volvox africanus]|uniref:Centrosomal protein of 70 kDa n=1 Tax=Volvox africanus TaxID=51714 RepID=A0ABQ5RPW7_9CHLO|nr:hypothetical protein VaNZ11_001512 [Volvox africanus]